MGAKLNVSVNCIDRHLPERANDTAIIWEGDSPEESQSFTYQDVSLHVNRFANALRARGVSKGDRSVLMPMVPEAAFAMLACARIGAIHSVVFGGFSPEALKDRSATPPANWLLPQMKACAEAKQSPQAQCRRSLEADRLRGQCGRYQAHRR
ncbi:MAG: hypothetical protein CM15mP74_35150 [Halieaceae bacterium]|nr:MAG: hypothetical protein CM15mP74_35150 [Halieaceae bacterium]